ncbi:MAG TPA: DNA recombination protein RmuC [Verrucomicrobiae bacterium]|nr:DNA recombination protein RmuC [Verrucomicrobiae bacterium]
MEIIVGLLIILLLVVGVVLFLLYQRLNDLKSNTATDFLKQDITELARGIGDLRDGLQQTMMDRLDRNHVSMQQQLSESAKIVADVTQRLTKLDETNRRVVDVADELKTLQNVLQNPKQRGVFGEYYLETVLSNVLPPGRFQMQYKFNDGVIVDAVIFLDRNQVLPIDSKFSLENYNRLIETTDKALRDKLVTQLKADLKLRIDETSKYIRPNENTMDFAFMFIPSEALYYDLLINKVGVTAVGARDLIEYAFRDKRVIIVSPTSFMAYLQTVLQGLRSLQIEEQAKDIQVRVGQLSRHLEAYDTFMQKLGNSLSTTVNHYNTANKELQKIDKDVVKIAKTQQVITPLIVDRPQKDE